MYFLKTICIMRMYLFFGLLTNYQYLGQSVVPPNSRQSCDSDFWTFVMTIEHDRHSYAMVQLLNAKRPA
jgi:hypothetical protein